MTMSSVHCEGKTYREKSTGSGNQAINLHFDLSEWYEWGFPEPPLSIQMSKFRPYWPLQLCALLLVRLTRDLLFYPLKCYICHAFYRVVKQVRQHRHDGEAGERWTPRLYAGVPSVRKSLLGLLHGSVDGKCRKGPISNMVS
jgi:hypothetical protein